MPSRPRHPYCCYRRRSLPFRNRWSPLHRFRWSKHLRHPRRLRRPWRSRLPPSYPSRTPPLQARVALRSAKNVKKRLVTFPTPPTMRLTGRDPVAGSRPGHVLPACFARGPKFGRPGALFRVALADGETGTEAGHGIRPWAMRPRHVTMRRQWYAREDKVGPSSRLLATGVSPHDRPPRLWGRVDGLRHRWDGCLHTATIA